MEGAWTRKSEGTLRWLSYRSSHGTYLALALLFITLIESCNAFDMTAVDVSNTSYYKELTRRNMVVVDELHVPLAHVQSIARRQSSSNDSVPSPDTDTGLPVPFDTSLGSNFTQYACPEFFAKFLADPTFLSCLPVSLLLRNSMSFFQAARSTTLLKKTLDVSCAASLAVCSPLMSQFAEELISSDHCENDYLQQNPLVMQAYAGLNAYEPIYQATCLKTNITGEYCFVEAMDSQSADDSYPYYTAVGLQLPVGSKPKCSPCLHETMELFSGYAIQKSQALSQTYLGCAIQINGECGESFANTQVKSVSKVKSTSTGSNFRLATGVLLASVVTAIGLI